MNEIIEKLLILSDLDAMITDAESETVQEIEKELGTIPQKDRIAKLKELREKIASSIPRTILKRYERGRKKYGHGIAPVINGVCTNCFTEFPTEAKSKPNKNEEVETCPICGIIIYWA